MTRARVLVQRERECCERARFPFLSDEGLGLTDELGIRETTLRIASGEVSLDV